jgi:hypothetical protein
MGWSVEFKANIPINEDHIIATIEKLPVEYIVAGIEIKRVGLMGIKFNGEFGVNGDIAKDFCKYFKKELSATGYKLSTNNWNI